MKKFFMSFIMFFLYMCVLPVRAEAVNIFQSPYVSLSPDGMYWTVKEELPYTDIYFKYWVSRDYPEYWYEWGTTSRTGIASTLRPLEKGEHYYAWARVGEVPVGKWVVEHEHGKCVHDSEEGDFHGYTNVEEKCYCAYYSGWIAYCADCEEIIRPVLMYMSKNAVATIDSINTYYGYYYVCPTNGHVETSLGPGAHSCKKISNNRYRVVYDKNAVNKASVRGDMACSFHMYDNTNIYEGVEVTPQTTLNLNNYTCRGYVFAGWNTKPDGSGIFYEDGAEILNLSEYDYDEDNDKGTVTLYAQWRKSESSLHIDPNGGTYDGRSEVFVITQDYGSAYLADAQKVVAPDNYTISFETNGGSEVEPLKGTMHFNSWILSESFNGKCWDNRYTFLGADGAVDTLTAYYEPDAMVLPSTSKKGWSFGGWYYDAEFTKLAGGAGDRIVPLADIVLYAQWVDLVLASKDNYADNDGKGAVDLSWTQLDKKDKNYLIYQSADGKSWTKVNNANDVGDTALINQSYIFTGKSETFMAPHTGIYNLTAYGAQGKSYGKNKGGLGGEVIAKIWLYQGETITINVGGINGYNGGGSASTYGNGGGSTTVVSNRRGIILVAAGGGGATSLVAGGDGGLHTSLRGDNLSMGESGGAGGGAGYIGGNAGEAVYHYCDDSCYRSTDVDILSKYSGYRSVYEYSYLFDDYEQNVQEVRYGQKGKYIPINGSTLLHLEVLQDIQKNHGSMGNDPTDSYIAVYDQNEQLIYQSYGYYNHSKYFVNYREAHEFDDDGDYVGGDYTYSWGPISTVNNPLYKVTYDADTNQVISSTNNYPFLAKPENVANVARWFGGTTAFVNGSDYFGNQGTYYYEDIPIPSGTTGIRIVSAIEYDDYWSHSYYEAKLTGGKEKTCGYINGQIISYKSAYGGSNYVNTACSNGYMMESGAREGNGALIIESVNIGFIDELELIGVLAPDKAAPNKVNEDTVLIEASEEADGRIKVIWDAPKDNGTDYYHKVKSYLIGSENPLCESNITKNNLVSGIRGYYYRVDYTSTGNVTRSDKYIDSKSVGASVSLNLQDQVSYVHVAAVDVAGNLGATAHIKVDPRDIAWNLSTEKITITDIIGGTDYGTVYAKGDGGYYVRADGKGPFQLAFNSKMRGVARDDYQIDYQIFASQIESTSEQQKYITKIPYSDHLTSTATISASRFVRKVEGSGILADAMNTGASRYNTARNNTFYQSFNIPSALHGQTIVVTPIAGATYHEDVKYSVWEEDMLNSITLIADGEAPFVSGAEILEGLTEIDRDEQNIHLDLTVTDDLSGVRDFKVTITNNDSMELKEYIPDADGHIRIHLTGDETIYLGDLSVEVTATDNVGNESVKKYRITEFAIEAWVERILPPHEPVFQRGESGILHITTWGYADRVEVEFPQEMLEQNPELNQIYDYNNLPAYIHEESLQFMIPLYMPLADSYTITVRAYKEGKHIDTYPDISVIEIEGSVLDEFRTRLR